MDTENAPCGWDEGMPEPDQREYEEHKAKKISIDDIVEAELEYMTCTDESRKPFLVMKTHRLWRNFCYWCGVNPIKNNGKSIQSATHKIAKAIFNERNK